MSGETATSSPEKTACDNTDVRSQHFEIPLSHSRLVVDLPAALTDTDIDNCLTLLAMVTKRLRVMKGQTGQAGNESA